MTRSAIEPRIGLAWKPFGIQNTAIRAGYSIYHDSGWSQGAQGLWQNPPYYAEVDQFAYGYPQDPCPFGNALLVTINAVNCGLKYGLHERHAGSDQPGALHRASKPGYFTGTSLSQNSNFKQGMVQQFNLNVEHQLPGRYRSNRRLCRHAQHPHSVLWPQHERQLPRHARVGRSSGGLHTGLRSWRTVL